MIINKETMLPFLIYNKPFHYNENIVLKPVTMENIINFQALSSCITVRKNSIFNDKKIIKMSYLEFLLYVFGNMDIETEYQIPDLSKYYLYAINLLRMCCIENTDITINPNNGDIQINGSILTPDIFDDIRRIIIVQNDIDFDIDEFLNRDTEKRLIKAQNDLDKNNTKANIEDYIDSLAIAMSVSEEKIMSMSIRKFWRYIKRYNLHENYKFMKTGEAGGMVKFKEPVPHWMVSLDSDDKYKHLKTDENELRNKVG